MTARENILKRIRARQGQPVVPTAEERDAVRSHIDARPVSARPRVDGDLRAQFRLRAEGLASTVDEVSGEILAPAAIARYLARNGLGTAAICWPEYAALDWHAAGLHVEARSARDGDLVGITGAYCAIAETGTIMLVSGRQTPAVTSLLPETHIALLRVSRIVRGMEEAWKLLREEHARMPRAVNFISGPSRTADIEQTVTLGAHGPYRVHIILTGA